MERRLFAAATLMLMWGLGGCRSKGCVSVLVQAPLLRKPYPTDMQYDPPLPPNDTLVMLTPGEYRYSSETSAKSWSALRVKAGKVEGYLIREDGVTGTCEEE